MRQVFDRLKTESDAKPAVTGSNVIKRRRKGTGVIGHISEVNETRSQLASFMTGRMVESELTRIEDWHIEK